MCMVDASKYALESLPQYILRVTHGDAASLQNCSICLSLSVLVEFSHMPS